MKILLFLGVVGLVIYSSKNKSNTTKPNTDYRSPVLSILTKGVSNEDRSELTNTVSRFSDKEAYAVYVYLTQYVAKNVKVPTSSVLYNDISLISKKYNIFT